MKKLPTVLILSIALVAGLGAVGIVAERSRIDSLQQQIGKLRSDQPLLGRLVGDFRYGSGFGSPRPAAIFNGGDPTGRVTGIRWLSWGGPTAVGTGEAVWVPAGTDGMRHAKFERATVVAFDLGTCAKHLMYQGVEWYFPSKGQSFNGLQFEDVCTGAYVLGPPKARTVVRTIPVTTCLTEFSASGSNLILPRSIKVRVPPSLDVSGLELYGDQANYGLTLGPIGWSCSASSSSDGIWIQIYPPSEHWSAGSVRLIHGAAITMNLDGGCYECRLSMVCPYFSGARRDWAASYYVPGKADSSVAANCSGRQGELVTRLRPDLAQFTDPPGVSGGGLPSGGLNPSVGLMYFGPYPDAMLSCTLPVAQSGLCAPILRWFVFTNQGASPSTVSHGVLRTSQVQ